MTKIIFLLPPSEGKKSGGDFEHEKVSFSFLKPYNIASQATEKDLKCKGNRYLEAMSLNKNIEDGPFHKAIDRYSGVMYSAINYSDMDDNTRVFFENNFVIFSGMYGLLKPNDTIANYKLPIEATGLRNFWQTKITDTLKKIGPDYIVNLLPISYQKMIDFSEFKNQVIHINFLSRKGDKVVKISHGVKKIKGEWVKNICENNIDNYNDFGGEIEHKGDETHINILHS